MSPASDGVRMCVCSERWVRGRVRVRVKGQDEGIRLGFWSGLEQRSPASNGVSEVRLQRAVQHEGRLVGARGCGDDLQHPQLQQPRKGDLVLVAAGGRVPAVQGACKTSRPELARR